MPNVNIGSVSERYPDRNISALVSLGKRLYPLRVYRWYAVLVLAILTLPALCYAVALLIARISRASTPSDDEYTFRFKRLQLTTQTTFGMVSEVSAMLEATSRFLVIDDIVSLEARCRPLPLNEECSGYTLSWDR